MIVRLGPLRFVEGRLSGFRLGSGNGLSGIRLGGNRLIGNKLCEFRMLSGIRFDGNRRGNGYGYRFGNRFENSCKSKRENRLFRDFYGPRRWFVCGRRAFDVSNLKEEADVVDTDKSAEETGVLDYQKTCEVVLYYDHIYSSPMLNLLRNKLSKVLPFIGKDMSEEEGKKEVRRISSTLERPLPQDANIIGFIPLKRDGGAFVKFEVPSNSSPKELTSLIIKNIYTNEKAHISNVFNYAMHLFWSPYPWCFPVKGTPWIEDLKRFPSSQVKVIFEGEKLTEEELYLLFRRYGKIDDIIPASATTPYATIIFKQMRSAICSKNCVTGIKLDGGKSTLHLQYIPIKRANYIKDFIINHQRISVPIILALLATIAVLIFDPIREWSIGSKITHRYSFDTYKDNKYFRLVYLPYLKFTNWIRDGYEYIDKTIGKTIFEDGCEYSVAAGVDGNNQNILLSERFEKVKQLKLWIHENINTFIIVRGPKGSGKQEFVLENTLQSDPTLRRKILYIDCDQLVKSRSENSLIKATALQLGYFPVFTWTNSISQFVDLAVQGMTGQKSGLSESIETQLKNMFLLTTLAIRKVGLSDYNTYKKDFLRRRRNNQNRNFDNKEATSVISTETDVISEDEYLQQHPEYKPIVVINNFSKRSGTENDIIFKMLAEWSSLLIQNNLSHVIFITHDVGAVKELTTALPNQVFKTISLSDASQASAKQYVLNQLSRVDVKKPSSIEKFLEPLGGRMLDLQAFIRRIRSGEDPEDALNEMVNQAAEQVTTFFLNENDTSRGENTWKTSHVWAIIKLFAENDSVDFHELIKNPLFTTMTETLTTLSALEKFDLVSLRRDRGILLTILIGRPLYKAAFKDITNDPNLFKLYETQYYKNLIALENDKIANLETEIERICRIPDSKLLKGRLELILGKIETATEAIKKYEAQIKLIGELKNDKSKIFGFKFS